ncbi:hypothetical protein Tco_0460953 [Tanacetum coccineum]
MFNSFDVIRLSFESNFTWRLKNVVLWKFVALQNVVVRKGVLRQDSVPKPLEIAVGLFTNCVENEFFKDFQDTSKSSDDNTNVVNAPQEPIVVNQDPGEKSSPSPLHIDHCCHECGDSLDGIFCRQCTCKSCGKGAHYGYNCPPRVPIILNSGNPWQHSKTTIESTKLCKVLEQQCPVSYMQHGSMNTMEFVFIVKLEMEHKSMFQFRTLLTILQVLQTILHNHNTYHTLSYKRRKKKSESRKNKRLKIDLGSYHLYDDDDRDDTIETESDEVIKSSVEDLVPSIPT